MKLYAKKSQENEAVQVLDGMDNFPQGIIEWGNGYITNNAWDSRGLTVNTPSGPVNAALGDWIVKGAPNDYYPVTQEKFKELYAMPDTVPSESDERTVNNAVRHQYRVLSDQEKADMLELKDMGAALLAKCEALRNDMDARGGRCMSIAITKTEEAVMWAVKGVTG